MGIKGCSLSLSLNETPDTQFASLSVLAGCIVVLVCLESKAMMVLDLHTFMIVVSLRQIKSINQSSQQGPPRPKEGSYGLHAVPFLPQRIRASAVASQSSFILSGA